MPLKRKRDKLFTGGGSKTPLLALSNLKRCLSLSLALSLSLSLFVIFEGRVHCYRSRLMINSKQGRQIKHLKVYETSGKTGNDGMKAPREKRGIRSREREREKLILEEHFERFCFCCILGLGLCRLPPGKRRVSPPTPDPHPIHAGSRSF